MLWVTLFNVCVFVDVGLLAAGLVAFGAARSERRRFVHPHLRASVRELPPSNTWIWMLTLACLVGEPVSSTVYYSVLLRQGAFPTYADSISIPISTSFMLAIITAPAVTAVTFACVRRRGVRLRWLAWRGDRPVLSTVVTLLFASPAAGLLASLVWLWADPKALPIDHAFDLETVMAAAWCLVLRSCLLQRRPAGPNRAASAVAVS